MLNIPELDGQHHVSRCWFAMTSVADVPRWPVAGRREPGHFAALGVRGLVSRTASGSPSIRMWFAVSARWREEAQVRRDVGNWEGRDGHQSPAGIRLRWPRHKRAVDEFHDRNLDSERARSQIEW